MLTALLPAVTQLASGWIDGRKEKAVAKQKLAVAKIEAQVTKVQSDASWEEKAIDSSFIHSKTKRGQFASSSSSPQQWFPTYSRTSRKGFVSSRTTAPTGCRREYWRP